MKIRICAALLIALLILPVLSGCSMRTMEARLDALEEKLDQKVDRAEDAVESAVADILTPDGEEVPKAAQPAPVPSGTTAAPTASPEFLTEEEVEKIALEHAGLTADQVERLRVKFGYDDGVPEYEVEFYHDRVEYEYEIHAGTGVIRSFDKDRD